MGSDREHRSSACQSKLGSLAGVVSGFIVVFMVVVIIGLCQVFPVRVCGTGGGVQGFSNIAEFISLLTSFVEHCHTARGCFGLQEFLFAILIIVCNLSQALRG